MIVFTPVVQRRRELKFRGGKTGLCVATRFTGASEEEAAFGRGGRLVVNDQVVAVIDLFPEEEARKHRAVAIATEKASNCRGSFH